MAAPWAAEQNCVSRASIQRQTKDPSAPFLLSRMAVLRALTALTLSHEAKLHRNGLHYSDELCPSASDRSLRMWDISEPLEITRSAEDLRISSWHGCAQAIVHLSCS